MMSLPTLNATLGRPLPGHVKTTLTRPEPLREDLPLFVPGAVSTRKMAPFAALPRARARTLAKPLSQG
jgi:hypothetical protein